MSKNKQFQIRVHDLETDEIIDRDMTAEELVAFEAMKLADNTKADEENKKAIAKSELLKRLGISEDEAKLLLG